ncbi:MAG: hypothetical protein ACR2G0_05700 [Chthoniobacterales bacterium]
MKKLLSGAFFLALALNKACALVGDTEAEIKKRYDPENHFRQEGHDRLGDVQRAYEIQNFIVMVSFENGFSVAESTFKAGSDPDERQLSPLEAEAILNLYKDSGVTWQPEMAGVVWKSSDGKLKALLALDQIQISTTDYARRTAAANKAAAGKLP